MDLDAELLALAGGDSSGDEGSASPPKQKSPSPQHYSRSRPSPSRDMANKGAAKVVRRNRRRKDDSDDELSA